MTPISTASVPTIAEGHAAARPRDADNTRQLLLAAARVRFARDGYAATTVRDIAGDAGVNVALINRYFTSKEGLFEACLERAVKELDDSDTDASTIDQMARAMVSQVTDLPGGDHPLQLLLLLRSSGDASADRIRRDTLLGFSERMANAADWPAKDASSENLLLRAQLALSVGLGILLLRSSTGLEPLNSASNAELEAPLADVLRALFTPPQT